METKEIFTYKWDIIEEDDVSKIVGFGLDHENKNVCILIDDFLPYCYVQLPKDADNITQSYLIKVKEYINSKLSIYDKTKKIWKPIKPVKIEYIRRRKLYYANMNDDNTFKEYPFLKYYFKSTVHVKSLSFLCMKEHTIGIEKGIKFRCHEHVANPLLQLCCVQNITPSGWIKFRGKNIEGDDKFTTCDYDYNVSYQSIIKVNKNALPSPLILSFDLEVYSHNPNKMPNATNMEDKIFQASCIFQRQGQPETMKKIIISMGHPDQEITGNEVEIISVKSELKLLKAFIELIRKYRPNIVTGYNIFGFDIPYIIERCRKIYRIESDLRRMGFVAGVLSDVKTISWSSSAYGNQNFEYVDAHGIIFMDMDAYIRRDYKFDNYKLKTVSTFFLGETKDPLTPKGIFKCYEKNTPKSMGIVAKYCVQDAVLVMKLFDYIKSWYAIAEMSSTFNVAIPVLYTQGQQIKVYSQIYKYCYDNGIIVEHEGYETKEGDKYQGAYVFQPVPGLYDYVVSFDFSSLYPTTIIAYNIDYSTFVTDESIPDSKCHIFDWEEHVGCEHDTEVRKTKVKQIVCKHFRFRFLKEPKGVLPTILQDLLDARKRVNRQIDSNKDKMKKLTDKKEIYELEQENIVLDKRQLSYKVSANSMYGAMGVKKGYLPFMPGAMCTTARGRQSIEKAANYIQSVHKGKLIYGDTDSTYICFEHIKDPKELYDFCKRVEEDMLALYPRPMKFAFEEKIYWRYFILTKKRYMALTCDTNNKVSDKIFKRGVLLARRDNSKWIRQLYGDMIMKIFYRIPYKEIETLLIDNFIQLFSRQIDIKDFIITKSVGEISDYKIKPLPDDPKKREKRLKDLGCTEEEYVMKALPAQAQLSIKMKNRGKPVASGTRLEHVITQTDDLKDKLFKKIEDFDYFNDHKDVLNIDFMYYLHLAINPIDEAIETAYGIKNFTKVLYTTLVNKYKLHKQLTGLFTPILEFTE